MYRPISLLPTCSKLVELAAQRQITKYMSDTKQWNMNNHGYKTNHGTVTTMINMTDKIFEACDENSIATAIATDQSAAF